MKTLRLLIAALAALAPPLQKLCAQSLPPPSELLLFEPNQVGEVVLMRRVRPVVLHMEGLTEEQQGFASVIAEFFSRASDLSLQVAEENWNLFIVRAPSLNNGDTINPEVLKRFKLPQEASDLVLTTTGWATGCGFYSFRDRNGRIAASFAAMDERLTTNQASVCLVKMIAASFGINPLRIKDNPFRHGGQFITYTLEISSLCSKKYEEEGNKDQTEKEFITLCMNKAIDFHFGAR